MILACFQGQQQPVSPSDDNVEKISGASVDRIQPPEGDEGEPEKDGTESFHPNAAEDDQTAADIFSTTRDDDLRHISGSFVVINGT